jgi:tetratricopeptide (TPR) repeat protein
MNWLDKVKLITTDDSATVLMRAQIFRKQGRMKELESALKEAHGLGVAAELLNREQWLALAQSGQMSQAEKHLSALLNDQEQDLEDVCDAYVIGYMRNFNFPAAKTLLDSWIADFPKSAWPHVLRGRIFFVSDDYQSAEASFRIACELSPHDHEFLIDLAKSLAQRNATEEAIALLESIDVESRFRPAVALELGLCRRKIGDTTGAVLALQEVIKASPTEPRALLELGRTHLENGDFQESERVLQKALTISPRDDEIHYVLAQSIQASGRDDDAKPHFLFSQNARRAQKELNTYRSRIQQNPRDLDSLVSMGSIMLNYAEPEEGVIRLLAALEIDPGNQRVLTLLADYYEQRATLDPAFTEMAAQYRMKVQSNIE